MTKLETHRILMAAVVAIAAAAPLRAQTSLESAKSDSGIRFSETGGAGSIGNSSAVDAASTGAKKRFNFSPRAQRPSLTVASPSGLKKAESGVIDRAKGALSTASWIAPTAVGAAVGGIAGAAIGGPIGAGVGAAVGGTAGLAVTAARAMYKVAMAIANSVG